MSGTWIRAIRIAGLTILALASSASIFYGLAFLYWASTWEGGSSLGWLTGIAILAAGAAAATAALYFALHRSPRRVTWRDWHRHD